MANIAPQPKIGEAGSDGGMAYSGAMALDKTEKTNDTYSDWMKYLIPPETQADTQVKDFDQSQYLVEHQADVLQDPITPKIAETRVDSVLTIGGKTELKAEFNNQTEVTHVPEQENIKIVPQPEVMPAAAESLKPIMPIVAEKHNDNFGQVLKDFGVDFGLFHEKVTAPIIKSAKETVTSFFSAMNDLFRTYILWEEKKPKSDEDKKKDALKAANKKNFFDGLRVAMSQSLMSQQKRRGIRDRIQEVNRSVGNQNVNYEGILNENDEIREEVLQMAEKANSEKSKEQIAADKRRRMMSATTQKKGPGITMSQDLAHNANNAAKLAG